MEHITDHIAVSVRRLRSARGWTQAELASRLDLSQSRLSQIERGDGSFSAEQFLTILRLFNLSLRDFGIEPQADPSLKLQNALARFGATHLQESQAVLPAEYADLSELIRDALLSGNPRYITALAPVLIHNLDKLHLQKPEAELAELGLQRRFPWLVENILAGIECELARLPSRPVTQRYQRAQLVLGSYLDVAKNRLCIDEQLVPDILDSEIRSQKTLQRVKEASSAISKRWGIITKLQVQDFTEALRATHE
ncbi:MAG: helix-turn-helix transcriptional regulator [Myxococcales bacterium]|nr:MAG: helix-turn-helix transcriptional regulator [Myxococcales bacterium]